MRFKRFNRKAAFTLSVCMMIVWALMGAGTTVAWFTDTTPVTRNTFIIGDLKLKVSYKNDVVTEYTEVTSDKPIFNDEALYEPGYTQVVYLKVENIGNVDFNYRVSVDDRKCGDSTSILGNTIHLPEHLKFGVIFAETEFELNRELARAQANLNLCAEIHELGSYTSQKTPELPVGNVNYLALIIFMPEEVGNEANYDSNYSAPYVNLGVTIYAQQAGTPMPEN